MLLLIQNPLLGVQGEVVEWQEKNNRDFCHIIYICIYVYIYIYRKFSERRGCQNNV